MEIAPCQPDLDVSGLLLSRSSDLRCGRTPEAHPALKHTTPRIFAWINKNELVTFIKGFMHTQVTPSSSHGITESTNTDEKWDGWIINHKLKGEIRKNMEGEYKGILPMVIRNETCYPLNTKRSHKECQQEQLGDTVGDEFQGDKACSNKSWKGQALHVYC